jgi:hypothetical protein
MKPTFTPINNFDGSTVIVRDNGNGTISWIPTDPSNSDYQAYLEHEAETK